MPKNEDQPNDTQVEEHDYITPVGLSVSLSLLRECYNALKPEGQKLSDDNSKNYNYFGTTYFGYTNRADRDKQIRLIQAINAAADKLYPITLQPKDAFEREQNLENYQAASRLRIACCYLVMQQIYSDYTVRSETNSDLYLLLYHALTLDIAANQISSDEIRECLLELQNVLKAPDKQRTINATLRVQNQEPLKVSDFEKYKKEVKKLLTKEELGYGGLTSSARQRIQLIGHITGKAFGAAGIGLAVLIGSIIGSSTLVPFSMATSLLTKGFMLACGASQGAKAATFLAPMYAAQWMQMTFAALTAYMLDPINYYIGYTLGVTAQTSIELALAGGKTMYNSLPQLMSSNNVEEVSPEAISTFSDVTGIGLLNGKPYISGRECTEFEFGQVIANLNDSLSSDDDSRQVTIQEITDEDPIIEDTDERVLQITY